MKTTINCTAVLLGATMCVLHTIRNDQGPETPSTPPVSAKSSRASAPEPSASRTAIRKSPKTATRPACNGCSDCGVPGTIQLVSTPTPPPPSTSKAAGKPGTGAKARELGDLTPGREAMVVASRHLHALRDLQRGARVTIPIADGKSLTGTVNMAADNPKNGWWVRSVALDSHEGAVLLVDRQPNGRLGGHLYARTSQSAFLLTSVDEGAAVFKEIPRTDILPECGLIAPAPAGETAREPAASGTTIPLLESLPGAAHVLYLDFDGEQVSGTAWNANFNSGNAIDAQPAPIDSADITMIWESVSEDFRPFTVNITTNRSVYDAASSSDRMMAIFTPTHGWYGSAGGVAYRPSFGNDTYRVCWVFTSLVWGTHNKGMCASHELGHTVSLRHDGDTTEGSAYHHGLGSGDMSWGPIMGAPYHHSIIQWNNGDYLGADNTQDDVALITGYLGRRSDDFADSHPAALPIGMAGSGMVNQAGIISDRDDLDVFRLDLSGGQISLNISPFHPDANSTEGVNLDVQARLLDATGNVILTDRPYGTVEASITRTVTAGTYYLEIDGAWEAGSNGYSTYGSLGRYVITGTVPTTGTSNATLAVTGNGVGIAHGDSTPDPADHTDFGTVAIGSGGVTHSFTLNNMGASTLTITQVSVTGGEFTAATSGLPWTIGAYSTRSLPVTFDPSTESPQQATVSIAHNGQNPTPFEFTLGGQGQTGGANDDSYEENDTLATAYDLRYSERTWLSALNGSGIQADEDWFEISITSGYEKLQIDCRFTDAAGDVDIALYDANGTWLASSTSTSDDEFIEFTTPTSGTHYIMVYYGNAGNSYDLWWDDLPNATPDDHGDDRLTATAITPMSMVAGAIGHNGDHDWFVFDVLQPSIVLVNTTGVTDTYGTLWSETALVDSNDDGGSGLNFQMENLLQPGRYYIDVRGYSSSTLGAYEVSLKTVTLSRFGIAGMSRDHVGYITLTVKTEPGRSYAIQRSTNLQTWQTVGTGVTGSATANWTDQGTAYYVASDVSKFYYRTILE